MPVAGEIKRIQFGSHAIRRIAQEFFGSTFFATDAKPNAMKACFQMA